MLTDLEMERRRQEDVAGGQVSVRDSTVGDMFHAESYLTTHGDALGDAERRQSTTAGL